jgi:hypothetical protein
MGAAAKSVEDIVYLQDTSRYAFDKTTGEHWANYNKVFYPYTGNGQYNNPYLYYDSPFIHTVEITNLEEGLTYYYRPEGSCKTYHFTIPKSSDGTLSSYPLHVGMTVDIGQTLVSNSSITALISMNPDLIILAGDLAYADGFTPLWDTFGGMIEPLAAHIPILTTGGNHEIQSDNWQSYAARYPTPYAASGSKSFCYWGKEVGVMHVIALCSYAGWNTTQAQYQWLERYLDTRVNRTKTPWLVAMMHVPMYNSNTGHWMEGELFRLSFEPLLHKYGVDLVLSGHVHAYERTLPVYNNALDPCGAVYMNIGDGGNYEGSYVPWRNLTADKTEWSAFRESSFGVAELTFLSPTVANYSWHRHACDSNSAADLHMNFSDSCVTYEDNSAQAMLTSDSVIVVKPDAATCPNKYLSSAHLVNTQVNTLVIILSVAGALLFLLCVVLGVIIWKGLHLKSVFTTSLSREV